MLLHVCIGERNLIKSHLLLETSGNITVNEVVTTFHTAAMLKLPCQPLISIITGLDRLIVQQK